MPDSFNLRSAKMACEACSLVVCINLFLRARCGFQHLAVVHAALHLTCHAQISIIVFGFDLISSSSDSEWRRRRRSNVGATSGPTLKTANLCTKVPVSLPTANGRSPWTDARRKVGAYDQNNGVWSSRPSVFGAMTTPGLKSGWSAVAAHGSGNLAADGSATAPGLGDDIPLHS